jgi:hypothetical protein
MAAGDDELETIPLPITGKASSVAIAISNREAVLPAANAFFELATSAEVRSTLESQLGCIETGQVRTRLQRTG